jgi:uncharacterized protein
MRGNTLDLVATILVVIGGINWGLIGLFDYNLVAAIFGSGSAISRLIYILVGAAALYMMYAFSRRTHALDAHPLS